MNIINKIATLVRDHRPLGKMYSKNFINNIIIEFLFY